MERVERGGSRKLSQEGEGWKGGRVGQGVACSESGRDMGPGLVCASCETHTAQSHHIVAKRVSG